ncbi:EpsG family protein [Intestinibacter bartlettii]|uniref:EpsG family protein n=1 Tax=Intestinibacter bartlettii TaxID=261299 RepID=UPI001D10FFD3|nr:EpsG family protein [Intestinibacter bartlettii]MCC2707587.1 EpsG family protein [Intestinibacter bartlettii]MCC2763037.1 EpsG family protein [Intestinibacter bartlettii]
MTIYVFMLIWVIIFGILANVTSKTVCVDSENMVYEQRVNLFFALMTFSVIIFFASLRSSVADTGAYISMFKSYPSDLSQIDGLLNGVAKRYPGFLVLTVLLKKFTSDYNIWFTIIAVISGICVMIPLYKYSSNFGVSAFLFMASCQFSWMFNGMRQFLVASIIFACTGLVLRKKFIPYAIIVCLLSTIHTSALILIPMYFIVTGEPWNKRTMLFVGAIILAILFTSKFTGVLEDVVENTDYATSMEEFKETDDGTSIIRIAVESVPIIIAFVYRNRIKDKLTPIIKLSINMSLVASGLYVISKIARSGIMLGRLPIYFSMYNLILLPWLIKNIFNKEEKRLVYYLMFVLYISYFYYQIFIAWDDFDYISKILNIK